MNGDGAPTRRRRNMLFISLLGGVLLSAIASMFLMPEFPWRYLPSAIATDSWYRPHPGPAPSEWETIDTGLYEVIPEQQSYAQDLLRERPALELSPHELTQLVGREVPPVLDRKPILVRGLALGESGHFAVRVTGTTLIVDHDTLAWLPRWMKRKALVVYLRNLPEEVFVTCGAHT